MKVHEYEARRLFAAYGLPVPASAVVETADAAERAAQEFARPVVVKAQVLVGGRGKAGGVVLASTPGEARTAASRILGMSIRGATVRKVLLAPAVDIARELYLGVVLDRVHACAMVMASASGGIDIEDVALRTPEQIRRQPVDPAYGVDDWQARALGFSLGLDGTQVRTFAGIVRGLVRTFGELDASLAEVNPLVVDRAGALHAIDAKLNLDDSALFRHPELAHLRDPTEETPAEARARDVGLSYIRLEGSIGCMVNGAGLAMATMDVIQHYGGEPANFLDVGGGASAQRVATAFQLILEDPRVNVILVNIFGGITRADDVARGILQARVGLARQTPLVVRLVGTNEQEGRALLAAAGITAVRGMDDAAKLAVAAA
ncbi:MAG: ADP-forming succinate--CoA ligase subunit beta [Actinobacteria bacterium]|nr:ADP-forming succinate--CoA ligase subunit beta [Actinomycetota bacterium]